MLSGVRLRQARAQSPSRPWRGLCATCRRLPWGTGVFEGLSPEV